MVFLTLRQQYPIFSQFKTPSGLISALHSKLKTAFTKKDKILYILIKEYQRSPDTKSLGAFLSLIFWPAINHIFNSMNNQLSDEENLWGDVYWAFLNTVSRYPLSQRTTKIAMNVKLDTLKKVSRWHQRENKRQEKFIPIDETDIANTIPAASRYTDSLNRAQMFLEQFVKLGVITEADFYLIMGTRVYGSLLREYASDHGLSVEAVKKQRQRAESAIKSYLRKYRKNKKSCPLRASEMGISSYEDN